VRVDIGPAELDIFTAGDPAAPLVVAAHPADRFDEDTARLLAEAGGAHVVCVNPRAPAPLAQMVDDVELARRALALGRWTFWGLSGGGWLAQLAALRHPDAVAGIIVESACACFRARLADPACPLSPRFPAWRPHLEAAGLLDETVHDDPAPGDTEWADLAGVGALWRRRNGPALLVSPAPLPAAMRDAMPELWTVDTRAALPSLRTPALVLAGGADPIVPVAHVRAVAGAIPGARFVLVDGAGHVPTAERRPEAAAAARGFLARL
jgi:3-oxoadipate enol-lactonase